jgi:hypothetical protein
LHVGFYAEEGGVVVLRLRHAEELAGVGEAGGDAVERGDRAFERLLFAPEFLRALLVGPGLRVLELLVDL